MKKYKNYDPNGPGLKNNNFIGLPFSKKDSELIMFPVPWDVTTSYSDGTSSGPENILNASYQLDLLDINFPNAWHKGIYYEKSNKTIITKNNALRKKAKKYISALEAGQRIEEHSDLLKIRKVINKESEMLQQWVYKKTQKLLQKDKKVLLIGGEHSTPLGYLKALSGFHSNFGILQIDAHCDLRKSYEGLKYSHASIMYNVITEIPEVSKLVQVGIRDLCQEERDFSQSQPDKIHTYFDQKISLAKFKGENWDRICKFLIEKLPDKVYISFDIDGLSPVNCPNTGTPVPGGLSFNEAVYLIEKIHQSGRSVIGADLCEVAGIPHEFDGSIGARIAYKLGCVLLEGNSTSTEKL
ncbi:agmatinase family protein [Membranihabitans maritimus]|uniref:agmatinase family protein n=1 Tax=Membranihabitans maritimus TaxID=2904244 RepID=UPI001F211F3B|nr:agmatinase family protein [Membranihabitans maritimus]